MTERLATFAWLLVVLLVAYLLSVLLTFGVVVASGYEWNPYVIQSMFLCGLVIGYSAWLARKGSTDASNS